MKRKRKIFSLIAAVLMGVTPVIADTGVVHADSSEDDPWTWQKDKLAAYDKTTNTEINNLIDANWCTWPMSTKSKPKIHLYKKSKIMNFWSNRNKPIALNDLNIPAFDSVGATVITGYAKIGKRKYYLGAEHGEGERIGNKISYIDDAHIIGPHMFVSEDLKRPKAAHSTKSIRMYYILMDDGINSSGKLQYERGGLSKKKENFVLKSGAKPITVEDIDDSSKKAKFMPIGDVYYDSEAKCKVVGSFAIKYDDYKKLKSGFSTKKKINVNNGYKIYSKKGKVYSVTTNAQQGVYKGKNDVYQGSKVEADKVLKSKELRKRYLNDVKARIKATQKQGCIIDTDA